MNDFFRQSGWFSHPGLPHGKVALQHVIAKKAGLSFEKFMAMEQAVYLFDYRHGEKVCMNPPVSTSLHCVVVSLLVAFFLKPIKSDTYLCVIHLFLGYCNTFLLVFVVLLGWNSSTRA